MKKFSKKNAKKILAYVIVICFNLGYLVFSNFVAFAGVDESQVGVSKGSDKSLYLEGIPIVRRQVFPEDQKEPFSSLKRTMKQKSNFQSGHTEITEKKIEKKLPTPVNINNLVIFIRFKGEDEFVTDKNRKLFENHYNGEELSLRAYMKDVSYGQFNVVSDFFPLREDGKFFSYEAKHPRGYYQPCSSENSIGYQKCSDLANEREFDLLSETISFCKPMIEKRYPQSSELNFSDSGKVDNIVFIVSGKEDGWKDLLWPHQFAIPDTGKYKDVMIHDKRIGLYNLMLESCFKEGNIGTSVHEFLHTKGFPDFYRYKSRGNPVGHWDLMSEQHAVPQFPLVYPRYKYGAFCNKPTPIKEGGEYVIYPSTTKDYTKEISYMLKSPISERQDEYFVVEYRAPKNVDSLVVYDSLEEKTEKISEKKSGSDEQYFWDESLEDEGLLVYRVNKRVKRGNAASDGEMVPDKIFVFRKGITDPALADGDVEKSALLKTGDSLGRTDEDFVEDLSGIWEDYIYFSDGENSRIRIYDIKIDETQKKATFRVEFGNTFITKASLKSAKTTIDNDNKTILFNLGKNFSEKYIVPHVEHDGSSIFQSEGRSAEKMPIIISNDMSYEVFSPTGIKQEWKLIVSPVGEVKHDDIKVALNKEVEISADLMNSEGVTYQWYCDKKPIAGETADRIRLKDTGDGKKHKYFVVATNEAGKTECAKTTVEWIDRAKKPFWKAFRSPIETGRRGSLSLKKNISPRDYIKEKISPKIRTMSIPLEQCSSFGTNVQRMLCSKSIDFSELAEEELEKDFVISFRNKEDVIESYSEEEEIKEKDVIELYFEEENKEEDVTKKDVIELYFEEEENKEEDVTKKDVIESYSEEEEIKEKDVTKKDVIELYSEEEEIKEKAERTENDNLSNQDSANQDSANQDL